MKHWSPQRLQISHNMMFSLFHPIFYAIYTTITYHSLMVFYLQQTIHEKITQRFSSYVVIHGKEQHVRQNVICKIKDLEGLINMLAILSLNHMLNRFPFLLDFCLHCVVLLLPMKPHLPMISHDLIVHIVQYIPSSNQYCLQCINELHPNLHQLLDDNKH